MEEVTEGELGHFQPFLRWSAGMRPPGEMKGAPDEQPHEEVRALSALSSAGEGALTGCSVWV